MVAPKRPAARSAMVTASVPRPTPVGVNVGEESASGGGATGGGPGRWVRVGGRGRWGGGGSAPGRGRVSARAPAVGSPVLELRLRPVATRQPMTSMRPDTAETGEVEVVAELAAEVDARLLVERAEGEVVVTEQRVDVVSRSEDEPSSSDGPRSAASAAELSGPVSWRATTEPIATMPATTATMAAVLPTAGAACRTLPTRPVPCRPGRRRRRGRPPPPPTRPSELAAADQQEQREHGAGQRAVHVLELGHQRPARLAPLEVLVDLAVSRADRPPRT